jgi:hypothetical protein
MGPSRLEVVLVNLSLYRIVVIALVILMYVATWMEATTIAAIIGGLAVLVIFVDVFYDWLSDGYVKRNELPEAHYVALHKHLMLPGDGDAWVNWADETLWFIYESGEPFPGTNNGAIRQYLGDKHDAVMMDELLSDRIWPRLNGCKCPRVEERPWKFIHKDTCSCSLNYVAHEPEPEPAAYNDERRLT